MFVMSGSEIVACDCCVRRMQGERSRLVMCQVQQARGGEEFALIYFPQIDTRVRGSLLLALGNTEC